MSGERSSLLTVCAISFMEFTIAKLLDSVQLSGSELVFRSSANGVSDGSLILYSVSSVECLIKCLVPLRSIDYKNVSSLHHLPSFLRPPYFPPNSG
ncbi:MAG: hypothetical protein J3Q66DRAFT_335207 [Benniella sp.]|nr:MAG: hypothetical protein J3Q66DRAFT_335207 [Benniella sp.]